MGSRKVVKTTYPTVLRLLAVSGPLLAGSVHSTPTYWVKDGG